MTCTDLKRYPVIIMSKVQPQFKLSIAFTTLYKEVFCCFLEEVSFRTCYGCSHTTTVIFLYNSFTVIQSFQAWHRVGVWVVTGVLQKRYPFIFNDKAVWGKLRETVWPSNKATFSFFKTLGTTYTKARRRIPDTQIWNPCIGVWLSRYFFILFFSCKLFFNSGR